MEKKTKVCWYCEKWQPGGIQAVQVNLLQHMDLTRIALDLVVSEDDTDLFDGKLRQMGIRKIVTLDRKYGNPALRVAANIFSFGRLIREGHYDVVHLNVCHGVELIYGFWAWLYRVPVRIVHCRNNDIGAGGRSRTIKIACHRICKRIFHNCATVKLANSNLAAEWLYLPKDLKRNQVQILRNGIDAGRYAFDPVCREQMRKRLQMEDRFVVGHVGHFNYQKNHEFLLEIFRELSVLRPDAVLLLVGEGERQPQMEELAWKYGIADRVIFYGVTNEVPAAMMAMDLFLFPSRFEGFGNVLLEAQAAGLPCYASESVIPDAVNVTDQVHRISLEQPASEWAGQIAAWKPGAERADHVKEIIAAGYDISNMAGCIQKLYLGEK